MNDHQANISVWLLILGHDKRVHNKGSRESHGSHADESKEIEKEIKAPKEVHKELKHEGYDKHSGTGGGKETKKGGHGKGGWGEEDYDKLAKHHSATDAAKMVEEVAAEEVEGVKDPVENPVGEQVEEKADPEQADNQKPFAINKDEFPEL